MTNADVGWTASRRNSNVSLGLVGIPSNQEPVQAANEFDFEFDFDPFADLDVNLDANATDTIFADPSMFEDSALSNLQIAPNLTLNTDLESFQLYQPTLNEQHGSYPYIPTDQHFAYPEPQSYYSAHGAPYFDYSTFGLAALPGNNAFSGYEDAQYATQAYTYNNTAFSITDASRVPMNVYHGYPTTQSASLPVQGSQVAAASQISCVESVPTPVNNSRFNDETPDSDAGSDDDYHDSTTKVKNAKRTMRKRPRRDSANSASTSAATPAEPVKYHSGEKPQKVDAKPWIRTNNNTEGDTRTAKINHWKNKYDYKPLPLGTWSSGKHTFKYTQYENVDFLTEAPMPSRKIKEYILNYPSDDEKRLVLWIQKMPADQGRRYGSKQHSKCAFRDCPIQRYVEGTISTGEYRVAFDEKHHTYGSQVDPFDCVAYAHLYCMEQFLDFEQVCQAADVRIDTRLDMPLEPNGRAAFSMVDVPARYEMERFVKAASRGKLRQTQRWCNYPAHAEFTRDQQKPHEHTLTHLAHCMYEAHQDDSHKKQAALRRVTVSQRRVHLGDLEMSVADKRIMVEVFGGKKKGRNCKTEDYYDQRIRHHIARAEQEAKDFLKFKRSKKSSSQRGKKRKVVEQEETDNDQSTHETADHVHSRKTRSSRQKKPRINYAESPVKATQLYDQATYMQQPFQQQQDRFEQSTSYMTTDLNYSSETTQVQPAIDPTLVTPYGLYAVPATPKFELTDFSDFPTCEDDLPDNNLEKLLALERRQSHSTGNGRTSILKSPRLSHSTRTPRLATFARRAIFGAQPVSQSKEYRANDPPSLMSGRRSARLAAKDSVGERCSGKRVRTAREV